MATQSKRRSGNEGEKLIKLLLEKRGLVVQRKAPDTRFQHNEIYGVADGIVYDHSNFILYQVKKVSGGLPSRMRELSREIRKVFGKCAATPLFWLFWIKPKVVEWYILEEGYVWSQLEDINYSKGGEI